MRATINGRRVTDRDSLHELLKIKLNLPEGCGRNLDAVHDVLTEPGKDRIITVKHPELLRERLGPYAEALLQMLTDAQESGHVKLIVK